MNAYALRWSVCVVAVVASFVFAQDVVDEGRIDVGDGVELYYQRYGEGPVGLVAMGRSFTAASLAPLAGDRAVVVYDTRSRGKSTAVDDDEVMGWQYELADLDAVIARLADRPVTIVGWSLWGGFAAVYAARHPERVEGLVMIGPMAPTVGMRARPDMPQNPTYQAKQELGRLEDAGVKESAPAEYCAAELRVAYADQVVDIAALVDRLPIICEDPNEHLEHVDATIRTILRSLGGWDFEADARAIHVPVLILVGDHDANPRPIADAWAELIPTDARVVELPQAGHMSFLDRPQAFREAVRDFLAGL